MNACRLQLYVADALPFSVGLMQLQCPSIGASERVSLSVCMTANQVTARVWQHSSGVVLAPTVT
jgi:hypothetical protein